MQKYQKYFPLSFQKHSIILGYLSKVIKFHQYLEDLKFLYDVIFVFFRNFEIVEQRSEIAVAVRGLELQVDCCKKFHQSFVFVASSNLNRC